MVVTLGMEMGSCSVTHAARLFAVTVSCPLRPTSYVTPRLSGACVSNGSLTALLCLLSDCTAWTESMGWKRGPADWPSRHVKATCDWQKRG